MLPEALGFRDHSPTKAMHQYEMRQCQRRSCRLIQTRLKRTFFGREADAEYKRRLRDGGVLGG